MFIKKTGQALETSLFICIRRQPLWFISKNQQVLSRHENVLNFIQFLIIFFVHLKSKIIYLMGIKIIT